MFLKSLFEDFGISDYLLLSSTILTIYVAHFYYKYFTRVNPLPGPFPLPFVGNLIQFYWYNGGNTKKFYVNNNKKYGDIYEVYLNGRNIVLNRSEHLEKLLAPSTRNTHMMMRTPDNKGLEELGVSGKGILLNNNYNSW